jgi:CheY-like chemotaxis protein
MKGREVTMHSIMQNTRATSTAPVVRTNRMLRLRSLVLCQDAETRRPVHHVLYELGVESYFCHHVENALELLASRRMDLVIVDCDDASVGTDFLRAVRQAPCNKTSVSLAIVNHGTSSAEAFRAGATLVMEKPISTRLLGMIVRASLGKMLLERQRSFRHAVDMPVTLNFGSGQQVRATAINLSEEGMEIQAPTAIPYRKPVQVHFFLPETEVSIQVDGVIAWADLYGRAGIRLAEVQCNVRRLFEIWLQGRFEQWLGAHLPAAKALPSPTSN